MSWEIFVRELGMQLHGRDFAHLRSGSEDGIGSWHICNRRWGENASASEAGLWGAVLMAVVGLPDQTRIQIQRCRQH
jgi:hypothetical protein